MNKASVVHLLSQTLDPNLRVTAEESLGQMQKIIGFTPLVLQIVMDSAVDLPSRQAGVILLKNQISHSWVEKEHSPGETVPYSIHEQDRAFIRDNLVEAVVRSEDALRVQLAICASNVIKHDFPARWPAVVDQVSVHLANGEPTACFGALVVLYQLVKNYEYKKREDRLPLHEAMRMLMPQMYEIMTKCLEADVNSAEAAEIRKINLKIFFALTQYMLPLELLDNDTFTRWIEVINRVVLLPVPESTNAVEFEERPGVIWWKEKKWAMHILTRIFDRYGSPGNTQPEYKQFSEFYIKTFSEGIFKSIFQVMEGYLGSIYISPRVLQQALNYFNTGVSHSLTWRFIKPHSNRLVESVIFPLMSYSKDDEELWDTDPYEYIRVKFDIFEDFVSPVTAAQTLLHSMCKKRKNVLPATMGFLMNVLKDPKTNASQKDGALHMIGTMAELLLKKKAYKDKLEDFLTQIVFPEFANPVGHIRARACWMLHYFAEVKYKNTAVLGEAFRLAINSLLNDKEAPVKVEAAIAVQMMLNSQGDVAKTFVEPQIGEITMQLLEIIRETENDDLTSVMQKIVCTYSEQLTPLATKISKHLVDTFVMVVEQNDEADEKAITAMGLLNTLETILSVMEDNVAVRSQLEPIVLQAVSHIFTNSVMEFYEEALTLSCDLTTTAISSDMWAILKLIYDVFKRDGFDYFTDMMPVLHNYVVTDTPAFLSNPDQLMAIYDMCKTILESDAGEDPECHAAKLLEVIILQCVGKNIDQVIPLFVQVALTRLSGDIKTSELRTMCLQVIIAALLYDPQVFLASLNSCANAGIPVETISAKFIDQWLNDSDCFIGLHDRKVAILGLCRLLEMPQVPGVAENANRFIPSLLMLFDGLKRAYETMNDSDTDSDSDCESGESDEGDMLESDEDEIDEKGQMYLESLSSKVTGAAETNGFNVSASLENGEDWSDDDDENYEETSLEVYTTPLDEDESNVDEYETFKSVIEGLRQGQGEWYAKLTSSLTEENGKSIEAVFTLGAQRKAAKESKNIEEAGGYNFSAQGVPANFSFGSDNGGNISFG